MAETYKQPYPCEYPRFLDGSVLKLILLISYTVLSNKYKNDANTCSYIITVLFYVFYLM